MTNGGPDRETRLACAAVSASRRLGGSSTPSALARPPARPAPRLTSTRLAVAGRAAASNGCGRKASAKSSRSGGRSACNGGASTQNVSSASSSVRRAELDVCEASRRVRMVATSALASAVEMARRESVEDVRASSRQGRRRSVSAPIFEAEGGAPSDAES